MNEITAHSWLSGALIFILACAVLFVLAYFVVKFSIWYSDLQKARNKERDKYETSYKFLQMIIRDYKVTDQSYDWICKWFDEMLELKYKNPEMTEVLYNKFREKYEDIAKKRVNENA